MNWHHVWASLLPVLTVGAVVGAGFWLLDAMLRGLRRQLDPYFRRGRHRREV